MTPAQFWALTWVELIEQMAADAWAAGERNTARQPRSPEEHREQVAWGNAWARRRGLKVLGEPGAFGSSPIVREV